MIFWRRSSAGTSSCASATADGPSAGCPRHAPRGPLSTVGRRLVVAGYFIVWTNERSQLGGEQLRIGIRHGDERPPHADAPRRRVGKCRSKARRDRSSVGRASASQQRAATVWVRAPFQAVPGYRARAAGDCLGLRILGKPGSVRPPGTQLYVTAPGASEAAGG